MDIVKVFFNGREEALEIINTGGDIIKYLTRSGNQICPLINTKIKLVKLLGQGATGKVFEIKFPGSEKSKRYVAKEITSVEEDLFEYQKYDRECGETYGDLKFCDHVDKTDVFILNGVKSTDHLPLLGKWLAVPTKYFSNGGCTSQRHFKRLDGTGIVTVPPKSFLCDQTYTEFAISLLVAELYRKGKSINFVDTFYFATCHENRKDRKGLDVVRYSFMEKIDATVRNVTKCLSEKIMNTIVLQLLHAIYVYQSQYSIVHGDLHDDNIFLELVTPKTEYRGVKLMDYTHFEFKIGDKSIFIPVEECPVIVKIGDWGLSVKYSEPMIGNEWTMKTGYAQGTDEGSMGDPWLPNFYTKSYDTVFALTVLRTKAPKNDFLKKITTWLYGSRSAEKKAIVASTGRNSRPRISALTNILSHVTPEAILTNTRLMGRYAVPPPRGSKIIVLGESS